MLLSAYRLRHYLGFGAIVLVAAAVPAVLYAVLGLGLLGQNLDETWESALLLLLVGLLVAVAIGLPVAFMLRRLLASLAQLTEAAEAVADGRQEVKLPAGAGQVGGVARSFGHLLAKQARLEEECRRLQAELEKEERIRHLAYHDALTGLPNRSLLFDRLQHAILKAEREKKRVAVMFVDLDRFNDTLGHDVGDLLLQEVAKRLRTCLRGTDTVARIGGDEFVVLLEDLGEPEHAAGVATNLIAVISLPQEIAGHALQVGAAVGIALYPEDGANAVELMKAADTARYAAKKDGKGTFRFFHAAMTEQAARRIKLENELRQAVQERQLELHYQPRVRFDSRLPVGVEALVRWRHPERGLLLPGDFLPLAEETGIVDSIGDWVLDQACRQLAEWGQHGIDTAIAVNLSARQLQQSDLAERVGALAQKHGIPPDRLQVEVAETLLMAEPEKYGKVLSRLRELGVTVAMDHFGIGSAGLAHLSRLPIDILKIDRSLVAAMADHQALQVVRTAFAVAQNLSFGLVAEGVETSEQAESLAALGCPMAQGYLFSPPQAADITEVWLATRALSQS